ncbi:MAG TPA: type II secretion system F family protein [Candidatus Methylomirabilis sp.]|nr:type II secretion system F family protein [Candidatus Methylomirabilis sp.]
MPVYRYNAKNAAGKKVSGLINAFNRQAAIERLEEINLAIVSLKDKTDSWDLKLTTLLQPVRAKDLVIFSRQFSVMISANLALVQSLRIVSEQTENITLKMVVSEVAYEVDSGSTLSAALGKRPKIFSPFYTNVVRSGETSGRLDEVLNYLADEMEKDYDMDAKIKGAMIYPAFVFSGLIVVGVLMMVLVVPKLTEIMAESGAALPLSTRIVVGISNFLINFWWMAVIILIVAAVLLRIFLNTDRGKRALDLIKLRLPVFGNLFQLIYMVRFTRSMDTLLVGGVTVSKSLEVVSGIVGNSVYQDLIEESRRAVDEGDSMAKVFFAHEIIPRMVPQMIVVGEKTGKLDLVFKKVSEFYGREIQNILANLVALLEPSIMVIMGGAVGIMVAAVIMPMYNLAQNL